MIVPPLPHPPRMRWRRLDVPGREDATFEPVSGGWRLTGDLHVEESGVPAHLRYVIDCDREWRTREAVVQGEVAGHDVHVALAADGLGSWSRDGAPLPSLTGAIDVDLGFTPATNTLPIRRLALAIGESRAVRTAWVRFPELRVQPLDQTYARLGDQTYLYEALVDGAPFTARLDTDAFGRVVRYEGLWVAEAAPP